MMTSEWSDEYIEYMNSARWAWRREEEISRANGRCERCGADEADVTLQVHHLTYEHLGNEEPGELQVLCVACHEIADRERAQKTHRRAATALYNARLDGYARKKYGDDWEYRRDSGEIEEEFDNWLERKERYGEW
jgi:hypothetical protein